MLYIKHVLYICIQSIKYTNKQLNNISPKGAKNKSMNVMQRIPAGLIGKGTETFAIGNEPYTIYNGHPYLFDQTPRSRIELYKNHMKANPQGEKVMESITRSKDDYVKVKQWMLCRFGGIDDTPDINEFDQIQEAEYVPCPKRGGLCPFEGKGCCTVEVSKGLFLSKAELAVIRLINLPDKLIASELFISTETVKNHITNSRKKIGLKSSKELVHWATIKGII